MNRHLHEETWRKTRNIGVALAGFAAKLCWIQLDAGRHFILENPAGSELFKLSSIAAIFNHEGVVKVNVPQCAMGLRVHGEPILKNTTLMASSLLLLEPFKGVRCTCKYHGELMGGNKTKLAQVWPRGMCLRICIGISNVLRKRRLGFAYPLGGGRGRPRKNPLGIVSRQGVIFDCPACLRRLHKEHPAHTRNAEPPLLCKFYNVPPSNWSCDACLRVKPREHPGHTQERGCRYAEVGGLDVHRRRKK